MRLSIGSEDFSQWCDFVIIVVLSYLKMKHRDSAPHTPRVILLGPTGCGKSVQAELLASKYGLINGKSIHNVVTLQHCWPSLLFLSSSLFVSVLSESRYFPCRGVFVPLGMHKYHPLHPYPEYMYRPISRLSCQV